MLISMGDKCFIVAFHSSSESELYIIRLRLCEGAAKSRAEDVDGYEFVWFDWEFGATTFVREKGFCWLESWKLKVQLVKDALLNKLSVNPGCFALLVCLSIGLFDTSQLDIFDCSPGIYTDVLFSESDAIDFVKHFPIDLCCSLSSLSYVAMLSSDLCPVMATMWCLGTLLLDIACTAVFLAPWGLLLVMPAFSQAWVIISDILFLPIGLGKYHSYEFSNDFPHFGVR
jgi:hypothetical protein